MNEKELGHKLQLARQKAGLTQQELCQKASLSISTLAKIERGAIKAPSIFTVASIASTVGMTLDELLGSLGAPSPAPAKKRSKSGISFVYFDVNGVLVRFFHRAFIALAEETGAAPDLIETTFWHYNDIVCRGEMPIHEFNAKMAAKLGLETIDWPHYYFGSIHPIQEMYDLVSWTAEHYRIGLFSNIMPGFIDKMLADKTLPPVHYDAIIDSSKIGAIKPEAAMYEAAQQQAGVSADEILLIDDSRANLMAAEHAGWRMIWFDDYHPEEGVMRVKQALEFL